MYLFVLPINSAIVNFKNEKGLKLILRVAASLNPNGQSG